MVAGGEAAPCTRCGEANLSDLLYQHPLKLLSVFVCVVIVVGLFNCRRRHIHIPLMLLAMTIDLAIVVYLEVRRGVVESIPGRPMTPLLLFHLCLSTLVLVLYGVQLVTGIRNARGRRSRLHPKTAVLFVVARFGNLVTSFLIN